MNWDRFDICEAWDCFSALYHGGQGSYLYSKRFQLVVSLGYKARPSLDLNPKNLTPNGKRIYRRLVKRFNSGEMKGGGK